MIFCSVIINVILLYIIIPTFFIKNSDALHRRIGRASGRDRHWYGIGRQVNLYCFDNIWKKALGRMVGRADAVIMDLRGFSGDRKGCSAHLVNNYDFDRALFIVDDGTDKNLFIETLREEARKLGAGSPNAGKESIDVTVFSCDDQGRRNTGQILCNMTSPCQVSGGNTVPLPFRAGAPFARIPSFIIPVMLTLELLVIMSVGTYFVSKTVQENAYAKEQDIVVAPPPEALTSFDLPEFSSVTADNDPHFLKMQVALGYDSDQNVSTELLTRKEEMVHIINILLRGKTYGELNSVEGKINFAEEIKAQLNVRLTSVRVKEVYFKEFVLN